MKDSDYTGAEKVMMFTLLMALIAVSTLTWFVGTDGWLGWLGVAVAWSAGVVALRARRRVRAATRRPHDGLA